MQISSEKHTPTAFAYFITIRTYATWLHGDQRGSVDAKHNIFNTPTITPSSALHNIMQSNLREPEFLLCKSMRHTTLQSILETAHCCKWQILAAHVRQNHLHIVLQSNISKEKTMEKIKCYATKYLKKHHPELSNRNKFWARHASTKNIWTPEDLFPVLHYVVHRQGKPMAVYYDKNYYDPREAELYEWYFGDV